jgi:hypothetical protein
MSEHDFSGRVRCDPLVILLPVYALGTDLSTLAGKESQCRIKPLVALTRRRRKKLNFTRP